ncbi:MAG: glycosyltransferase [Cyanothece sp. SIO2G6]|nr:glycosyltransferase [Cyanothece sp. SIO2G6]
MNITLVNTNDIRGGAARAVYRLYQGLRHIGQNVTMLCHSKASDDPNVAQAQTKPGLPSSDTITTCMEAIQTTCIDRNRSDLSNTFFSLSYPGVDLSHHSAIKQADVINLHWIARFQSPSSIKRLLALGKPVVWTLHDAWAFTGGCHYTAGCLKYRQACRDCPQLDSDTHHLTAAILADKIQIFKDFRNLTIVTPSRWLSDCAGLSRLFQGLRVETIPNSLEADVFCPMPKIDAKTQLDINPDVTTIMFGAVTAAEERKGFSELIQALWHCLEHPQFCQQVDDGKIEILCVGYPSDLIHSLGIPVRSFGYVDSDDTMSQIYSASDLFVLPSLEDNLPNTMLEAMSCGTPVVAFDVGGIPDVVRDRVTGRIVPVRDVVQLANAILDCVFDPKMLNQMGGVARQSIVDGYTLPIQAQRYLDLFQELLDNSVQISVGPRHSGETVIQKQVSEMASTDEQSQVQLEKSSDVASADVTFGQEFGAVFEAIALNTTTSHLQQTKKDFHKLQTQFHSSQEQLQQTQTQLQQTQEQWHQTLGQLQQTQEQLQQTQEQLQQTQEQLQQTQGQLQQAQEQWQQHTQEQMQQTQEVQLLAENQINELREQFQQVQNRLQQTQVQLAESQQTQVALTDKFDTDHQNWQELLIQERETIQRVKMRLKTQTDKLKQRLQGKISALEQCQETITTMETSKFWKLRNHWFRLKQKLGMSSTR